MKINFTTDENGDGITKFSANLIDLCNGNVYMDSAGVWHYRTESACDCIESIQN